MAELSDRPDPDQPNNPESDNPGQRDQPGEHDRHTPDRRANYLNAMAAAEDPAFDHTDPDPADLPTGEKLANPEKVERSRTDRILRELCEEGDDVADVAKNGADTVQGVLAQRPPTGHAEVRTPHAVMDVQHHAIQGSDVATSLIVLGVAAGQGLRKLHEHFSPTKENP